VHPISEFTHTTSGTPAAGIGIEHAFKQETSAANTETIGSIGFIVDTATATAEDASFSVSLMAGGAAKAEKFAVESTGALTLVNAGSLDNTTNGTVKIDEPSTATNTVVDILTIGHSTSGTAANGIGTGVAFQTEDNGGAVQTGMTLDAVTTDATAASEDYDFVVSLMDGGTAAAERFRIDSGGIITQSAESAATNAVVDVLNIKHGTTGTEAAGIGIGILFTQETGAVDEIIASIDAVASDVTGASEDGEIVFSTMTAGAAATEKMRIHDTGEVEFQKGVLLDAVTADPCGSGYPEGSIFYNTTGNIVCYCDGTNDLDLTDGSACFD
jgi:hypothetical protein